jgi:deazaflavin-dependent oxidoreductase (nitroreductase family)
MHWLRPAPEDSGVPGSLLVQMTSHQPIEIPPRGTRGANPPGSRLLTKLFKPLIDMQISRLRKTAGAEQPKRMGFPVLLLTTTGARTRQERTHVLGGFPDGDDAWLIVASKGGAAEHPSWFINLAKNPDKVWIEVGSRRLKVKPESLRGFKREEAYAKVVAVAPRYGSYLRKTDREIPVVRLTPES